MARTFRVRDAGRVFMEEVVVVEVEQEAIKVRPVARRVRSAA